MASGGKNDGLQTFPKTDTYDAGTVFQSREAVIGKVRSAMVEKRVRQTMIDIIFVMRIRILKNEYILWMLVL